jgi:hypothetical protein
VNGNILSGGFRSRPGFAENEEILEWRSSDTSWDKLGY